MERDDDVISCSSAEPTNDVGFGAAGADDDHRYSRKATDASAYLDAVYVRQHIVQQDYVGRMASNPTANVGSVLGHLDVIPLVGKVPPKCVAKNRVALRDKHMDRPVNVLHPQSRHFPPVFISHALTL